MKLNIVSSQLFLIIAGFISVVCGNKAIFDDLTDSQVCSGMYAKHDWGGSIKPHIELKLTQFDKYKFDPKNTKGVDGENGDINVSFVIFEYKDLEYIGYEYQTDDGRFEYKYICDEIAITNGWCDEKQKGGFIDTNTNSTKVTVMSSKLTHLGIGHINYTVHRSGYYCISTFSIDSKKYKGVITFQNAFGQLSASEIPKLPGYGILTLCYAIALALFGFQFFKKRKENQILPLQRYLLAMLGFLTFDTIVVWSYYDLVNRTKNPSSKFVTFYMFFLSLLNSAKVTFSFFLLLCISLGYGVVVLKLDKKIMFRCKILAACHFIASIVYLVSTYYSGSSNATVATASIEDKDLNGLSGLLPLIPVTITLTAYYLSILVSIRRTTASLHQQRQIIKLQLYENLFRIIFLSVVLTFGGLVLSSFIYLSMSTTEMVESYWKSAFFLFDFWPSVVFFGVFMGVAWLWRPTETSYMLAVSQQLSTDENVDENNNGAQGYHQGHEFELDDLSLLSHSDNEPEADNDSFELSGNQQPSTNSQSKSSPKDEELHESKHSTEIESQSHLDSNNTLFELGGEESDDEHKGDDRLRDRN